MSTRTRALREQVELFRKGLLGKRAATQMCFMVSSALAGYLEFTGACKCRVVQGEVRNCGHYWIALENGQIIDATADQFRKPNGGKMPPIYIGQKPRWYEEYRDEA